MIMMMMIADTVVICFRNSFQVWLVSQRISKTWSGWLTSTQLLEIWYTCLFCMHSCSHIDMVYMIVSDRVIWYYSNSSNTGTTPVRELS